MALEYNFYIELRLPEDSVDKTLLSLGWSYTKETINEKAIGYNLDSSVGFDFNLLNFKRVVELNEKESHYESAIIFRVDKNRNTLKYKENLIEFVFCFLENHCQHAVLLFNGEVVILVSNEQGVTIAKSDFWNDTLKEKSNKLHYKEKEFEVL